MLTKTKNISGFTLVELVVVIVVMGIIVSVALQKFGNMAQTGKIEETKSELEELSFAIIGNPELNNDGIRSDFGYVGDIGSIPPNLDALAIDPGLSTWNGPYLMSDFLQDPGDFKTDPWQSAYTLTGAAIISSGSGSNIVRNLAGSTDELLMNRVSGNVYDLDGTPPGLIYRDSVLLRITFPDGAGGMVAKSANPDIGGYFTFDSIPIGNHDIRIIYVPNSDTIRRFVTVIPNSNPYGEYYLASNEWFDSSLIMGVTIILRPDGIGSLTNLTNSGCGINYQCVNESTADGDATRVSRASNSFVTDVYSIEDPGISSGAITGVAVYCRARKVQTQGEISPTIYTGGAEYNGTAQNMTTSYVDYFNQWATNPNTGSAWTWTDIINIEAGVRLRGQNFNFSAYCTQVWVEVYYIN